MKINKEVANGTEGCLLIYPDIGKTKIVFRIYERTEDGHVKKNEDGHAIFKDYDIRHHDLSIRLLDGHFYETDEGNFLDY